MLSSFFKNKRELISVIIVAIFCLIGLTILQINHLKLLNSHKKVASLETLKREIESEKLRLNFVRQMPTFNFNNLIADWVFLSFLQYFGDDESRAKTGYSLSPEYFEVILNRDPYFLQAYLFLSSSTSLYAAMPERSIALMEQGLKYLSPKVPPKSYYIWRYKGIDELLFLGDAQAAKESFKMAAEWASIYADPESKQVAVISQRTSEFLARNPKSISAQISAWTMVLNNPVDINTRNLAIKRIQSLGGEIVKTPQGITVKIPIEN